MFIKISTDAFVKITKCICLNCKMYLSRLKKVFVQVAASVFLPSQLCWTCTKPHSTDGRRDIPPIVYNSPQIVKYIIYCHNSKFHAFRINANLFCEAWSEIHTSISPNFPNLWFSLQCAQNITNRACILKISKSSVTYLNQTNAAWILSRVTKQFFCRSSRFATFGFWLITRWLSLFSSSHFSILQVPSSSSPAPVPICV